MLAYVGSKLRVKNLIVDYILTRHKNLKYVYDLFGGGGAITFEFLKRGLTVFYNDINPAIANLFKYVKNTNHFDDKLFYKWISREEFNYHKHLNDWYSGFVKIVWSYNNNLRSYVYNKEKEPIIKQYHDIYLLTNIKPKGLRKKGFRMCHIERTNSFKRLFNYDRSKLFIFNKSYDEITIDTPIDETIIYLDPPYRNHSERFYNNNTKIDYEKLYDYIKNSKYPVYLSEYTADNLYIHLEYPIMNNFNSITKIERLYSNQPSSKPSLYNYQLQLF